MKTENSDSFGECVEGTTGEVGGYCVEQVTKDDMDKLPYIVAVDFDGTLVKDCYPAIGELNERVFKALMEYKSMGWKLILWTCRDGRFLFDAVKFCGSKGLFFDAVNENLKEVQKLFGGSDTRKVYANVYLDDKAVQPKYPDRWKRGM